MDDLCMFELVCYGWREKYSRDDFSICDPNDYEYESDYLYEKYAWRIEYKYNEYLDPEDYETKKEYLKKLNEIENEIKEDIL